MTTRNTLIFLARICVFAIALATFSCGDDDGSRGTKGPREPCVSSDECAAGYTCGGDRVCCGCPGGLMECYECPGLGADAGPPPMDGGAPTDSGG